jgi:hypothetical protein
MTSAVAECERAHWSVHYQVDKYSPAQTCYAEGVLRQRRSPLLRARIGLGLAPEPRITGRQLRALFGAPEDGVVEGDGNLLTSAGLTNLFSLWLGATGTAVNPLRIGGVASGGAVCGVGSTATAATTADVHLGGDGSSSTAWYQECDATFPTSALGVATLQATFGSSNANFAWNEWCWATGNGTVTAGATLASVYATGSSVAMVNHKIPASSLGTKGSGASWVFTTTITIA